VSFRSLGAQPGTGSRVGPWTLHEKLGQGGLATVYRAVGPEGSIALKVMNPEKVTEEQVKRIEREFRAMSQADSPYVVAVLGSGEHHGYPWLALEYVDGQTLEAEIAELGRLRPEARWERVQQLLRGLLEALGHIHAMGMVHRDFKPSNVLVDKGGQPKLTDFGSVKAPDTFTTNLTMAGHLVGTVAFMAPEQITEDRLDHRADLYALGATLYMMLTGRKPVEADSIAGYLAKHLMEDPRPPIEVEPKVPLRLSRICMRLLKKDPEERFASAEDVAEALDEPDDSPRVLLQGRDSVLRQIELLLRAFQRGAGRSVAVLGPEGCGRTALIEAIAARGLELEAPVSRLDFPLGSPIERALREALPGKGPLRRRLAEGVILLADDLDRASDSDLRTLEALLRDTDISRRLLFVYSLDAVPGQPLPQQTARLLERLTSNLLLDPSEAPLVCQPLNRREVIAMLRDLRIPGGQAAALGKRLHEHGRGRPREVLEQIDALEQVGWLKRGQDGRMELTVPRARLKGSLPIPEARRQQILSSWRRLSEPARGAMTTLAVLGLDADSTTLESIRPGAVQALAEASAAGLVLRRTEGLYELLRFSRPEQREVLYEQLEDAERAALHRSAAEHLLHRHKRRLGGVAEAAAEHLLQAGEPARAYPLLVIAAQRAARKRQLQHAKELADKALEVSKQDTEGLSETLTPKLQQQVLAVRGEVLLELGRAEDARASLQEALDTDLPVPGTILTEIRARLGMALVTLGQAAEGRAHLERALAELDQGSPVRFATVRSLAEAYLAEGRIDEASRTWHQALNTARDQRAPGREGECLLGLGELELRAGNPMRAARALEMAEQKLRAGRSTRALALCLERLSEVALLDGRLRAATARADEAIAMARQLELHEVSNRAALHKAEALMSSGRDDEARALVEEQLQLEQALPGLDLDALTTLHHLGLQTLGPSAVSWVRHHTSSPEAPAALKARWELYAAWAMVRDGSTGAALAHARRGAEAASGSGLAGLRMEALLCQAALGVQVGSELRELVQRVLSGMAPELRPGFVERLRRLKVFKG
jgi:serine/threonine protein kinase/tetratricopeptide (TPR) repeat protein